MTDRNGTRPLSLAPNRPPNRAMSDLFDPRPDQWGLRGDPDVWDEMAERLALSTIPESPDAVQVLLTETFNRILRHDLNDATTDAITGLRPTGGLSCGLVHLPTWRNRLIPLLVTRATSASFDSIVDHHLHRQHGDASAAPRPRAGRE